MTILEALSSKGTHGPPKGQPVPVAMSISMPSQLPRVSQWRSISIHRSER